MMDIISLLIMLVMAVLFVFAAVDTIRLSIKGIRTTATVVKVEVKQKWFVTSGFFPHKSYYPELRYNTGKKTVTVKAGNTMSGTRYIVGKTFEIAFDSNKPTNFIILKHRIWLFVLLLFGIAIACVYLYFSFLGY